jgi:hypothetical protein
VRSLVGFIRAGGRGGLADKCRRLASARARYWCCAHPQEALAAAEALLAAPDGGGESRLRLLRLRVRYAIQTGRRGNARLLDEAMAGYEGDGLLRHMRGVLARRANDIDFAVVAFAMATAAAPCFRWPRPGSTGPWRPFLSASSTRLSPTSNRSKANHLSESTRYASFFARLRATQSDQYVIGDDHQ